MQKKEKERNQILVECAKNLFVGTNSVFPTLYPNFFFKKLLKWNSYFPVYRTKATTNVKQEGGERSFDLPKRTVGEEGPTAPRADEQQTANRRLGEPTAHYDEDPRHDLSVPSLLAYFSRRRRHGRSENSLSQTALPAFIDGASPQVKPPEIVLVTVMIRIQVSSAGRKIEHGWTASFANSARSRKYSIEFSLLLNDLELEPLTE